MRKQNHHRQILKIFEELKKSHPKIELGNHIATALDGHDVWGISDKSFLDALKEYKNELDIDVPHDDDELEKIIKGGMNLTLTADDDDDDEFYDL